jgi:hypothetical protein
LITIKPGLAAANAAASIIPRVASVSGAWMLSTSAWRVSSASVPARS